MVFGSLEILLLSVGSMMTARPHGGGIQRIFDNRLWWISAQLEQMDCFRILYLEVGTGKNTEHYYNIAPADDLVSLCCM